MQVKDILNVIQTKKEYWDKLSFVLRHRNNLDASNPTFDDPQYKTRYELLKSQYDAWLESEI